MKKLGIILLPLLLMISCKPDEPVGPVEPEIDTVIVRDTVLLPDTILVPDTVLVPFADGHVLKYRRDIEQPHPSFQNAMALQVWRNARTTGK